MTVWLGASQGMPLRAKGHVWSQFSPSNLTCTLVIRFRSACQSGFPGKGSPAEPSLWLVCVCLCVCLWMSVLCVYVCLSFPRQDPVLEHAESLSGIPSAFFLLNALLPGWSQLKCAILANAFWSLTRLVDLSQSSHSLKLHTHLQDSLPPASPVSLWVQMARFLPGD